MPQNKVYLSFPFSQLVGCRLSSFVIVVIVVVPLLLVFKTGSSGRGKKPDLTPPG